MSTPAPETGESGPDFDPAQPPTLQPNLATVLGALAEDAQTLLEAEAGFVKAAIGFALSRIKSIAIAAVLALFFLFFTLMAGVVGLLLALSQVIGAWAAAGAVTGVLALLTLVCVWRVVRSGKQMIAVLTGKAGEAV